MPRKTKPRIDKKKAVTFRLVNRSQNDPLTADETAPQHVLVEVASKDDKRIEEQRKYGIYFDDDYDYLKHLKSLDEFHKEWDLVEQAQPKCSTSLNLPSSVFPSVIEEEEGLLNKAALPKGPQVDWDPDIVAALDEDFNYEDPNNQLDDNFVVQALGLETDDDDDEEGDDILGNFRVVNRSKFNSLREKHNQDEFKSEANDSEYEIDSQKSDELNYSDEDTGNSRDRTQSFNDEETRSVFTNYSMTSSVLPRNSDEKFEALYEREYCDDFEASDEDIEGTVNANECPLLKKLTKEDPEERIPYRKPDEKLPIPCLNESDEETQVLEIEDKFSKDNEDRFDCETILSTYSNLYNHPKLIRTERSRKLKVDPITGVVSQDYGLTKKNLKLLDSLNNEASCCDRQSVNSRVSRISVLSERHKNETHEERKERKAAFKEFKRERRTEKKANKLAFKIEGDKHLRELKNKLNGMKLV